MPKLPLTLAAGVVLNQLQIRAALERYQGLSEVDHDALHRPDAAADLRDRLQRRLDAREQARN